MLRGSCKDVDYEVVEKLPDDPWQAVIKSASKLTKQDISKWHKYHVVDVDKKNVPYYFIVKDTTTSKEYVWYSDDANMMPLNTKHEISLARKAGRKKHLVEDQLDFDTITESYITEDKGFLDRFIDSIENKAAYL